MKREARDEAIEVMRQAYIDATGYDTIGITELRSMLRALTSPRVTRCETCGGTGKTPTRSGHSTVPCRVCSGTGEVSRKPIAVLWSDLEQRVDEDTEIHVKDGLLWVQGETGPLKPMLTEIARLPAPTERDEQ